MSSSIVMTVQPAETPVSLDEVKERLRMEDNTEDTTIQAQIQAATAYCQEYTWSQFVSATFVERFDCGFPCIIVPQKAPLVSATSLAYVDTAGVMQTLAQNTDYIVDAYAKPGRIYPAYNKYWPSTRDFAQVVTLTYVAGYGTPADVPDEIREAIMMKVESLVSDCDGTEAIDKAIHSLLDLRSFRVFY